MSYIKSWKEFIEKSAQSQEPTRYNPDAINCNSSINPPAGPVLNETSLAIRYKMAATLFEAARVTGNGIISEFVTDNLKLIKQVHQLQHGKQLDGDQNGKVIKEDVKELIQDLNWDKDSRARLHSVTMTSTTTGVSTVTLTATQIAPLQERTLTISTTLTTTPTMQTRATLSTNCNTTSPQGTGLKRSKTIGCDDSCAPTKKHYKVRSCPLCGKEQTNLSRHLDLRHTKKGEIPYHRIKPLVYTADQGNSTHKEESWFSKKSKKTKKVSRHLFKCPLCKFVTAHLSKHLTAKHQVEPRSGWMARMLEISHTYDSSDSCDDFDIS